MAFNCLQMASIRCKAPAADFSATTSVYRDLENSNYFPGRFWSREDLGSMYKICEAICVHGTDKIAPLPFPDFTVQPYSPYSIPVVRKLFIFFCPASCSLLSSNPHPLKGLSRWRRSFLSSILYDFVLEQWQLIMHDAR